MKTKLMDANLAGLYEQLGDSIARAVADVPDSTAVYVIFSEELKRIAGGVRLLRDEFQQGIDTRFSEVVEVLETLDAAITKGASKSVTYEQVHRELIKSWRN